MNMKLYVLWTLLFAAVEVALTLVQFLLRKKDVAKTPRALLTAAKALIAIACAVIVMAGPVCFRPVQPLMVILYAVLLTDAAAQILYGVVRAVCKRERRFAEVKALSLILGVLFFVYGTVNMQIIRPDNHVFISPKLTSTHKIVFIADLHAGSAQTFDTIVDMLVGIEKEEPDAVILGGDITDDYTTKAEMTELYRLFGQLDAPVYFIFGNHEVVQHAKYMRGGLHYTEEELVQTMRRFGVTVLKDEYAVLAPDLLLLGREDAALKTERMEIDALPNPAPEKFLLVADHQPTLAKDNLAAGTDLQISGHTHAGQLFPNGLFYSFFGYTRGEYSLGEGRTLLVSPGASGWRVPFRTQAHCRYEVITLRPEQN